MPQPDDFASFVPALAALSPGTPYDPGVVILPATLSADDAQDGETLQQVLRTIVIVHHELGGWDSGQQWRQPPSAAVGDRGDADGPGWREAILDSTLAGAVARSVLEIHGDADDPADFSILGFGDFRVEIWQGSREYTPESWSEAPRQSVDRFISSETPIPDFGGPKPLSLEVLIKKVLNFLTSPLGFFLETTAALLLTFGMILRTLAVPREVRPRSRRRHARREKSGHRRSHRRRRRHSSRRRRRRRLAPTLT